MTWDRRRLDSWIVWPSALLSCTALGALVAITVTLAAKVNSYDGLLYRMALAAAFDDILTLTGTIILAMLYLRQVPYWPLLFAGLVSALLGTSALFMTIYALIWMWNDLPSTTATDALSPEQILTAVAFSIWSIALITLLVLHVHVLWPQAKINMSIPANPQSGRNTPNKLVKRSTVSRPPTPFMTATLQNNPQTQPELLCSAFSAYSDSVRPSLRNSVSRVIRPVTTKTKLLFHHHHNHHHHFPLVSHDSSSALSTRQSSIDARRESDGFENWDGQSMPTQSSRETRFHKRYHDHKLETIPGSRPGSCGTVLDQHDVPEYSSTWAYTSPTTPTTPPEPPPRSAARPAYHSSARDLTPITVINNTDQSHIHPIFRDESPSPHPLPSPRTVITASPYAGQVVSAEHHDALASTPRYLHSARHRLVDGTVPPPASPAMSESGSFGDVELIGDHWWQNLGSGGVGDPSAML